jgi:hypothetical protein
MNESTGGPSCFRFNRIRPRSYSIRSAMLSMVIGMVLSVIFRTSSGTGVDVTIRG